MGPTSAFTSCLILKGRREGGRRGGRGEKEVWVGCGGLARRKQVRDEGLSGGYKGAVHWKRAGEPSMGLKNTQTKLGMEEGMSYNGTGPHAWFKEPVRNTERGRQKKTEWK